MLGKTIAKNIRKYRKKLGLTQVQLAKKANIPYSTYLNIELAYTLNPSIQMIVKIAKALGVSVDELIKD
ncbi:MAG: hypothetical protein B6D55_06620 [Candidatus Omnitrophica bacterium 4484_70.2]|nr:MAG: hypothetical protein B6D55_06620 [Candidatus Omnitrophica bacterium 4484_70.2]